VEVVMSESARTIDTLLDERRTFAPSPEFLAKARVKDQSLFEAAAADPEGFWAEQAKKYVTWYKPFDKVLEWDLPFAKWFVGGEMIGPIARPKWIAFTPDLPKTRSGKIMRRLLRDIAENRKLGDTTTLADSSIVADLQRRATEEEAKEQ
jgi:Acetyl-coenzyme A synthetase N-terminus